MDDGELRVNISRFEFSSHRTFRSVRPGSVSSSTIIIKTIFASMASHSPRRVGITLRFEQWKNMTSLEGLIAVEHLKTLINKKVPTDAVVSEEEEEFSLLNLRNNLNEHPRRPSSIIQFSLLQIS